MSNLKNAILIILLIASIQGLIKGLNPSENYTNHVELADNYDLYWKNDQEKITFELHFTSKWALFGISDDSYADFITGWLTSDLKGHFNDHYGNLSKFESFVDNEANWLPILAKKRENTTILKFSRYVKLCDETRHDLDIEKGQMNVVFATGDEFLDEKHIKYNKTQIGNLKVALIDSEVEFSCGNLIKDQSTFGSKPTDTYQNFVDFIPSVYRLYWNITKADGKNSSDMIGEIHCKTDGWVGFGFSPNGGMDSSDVAIAWSRNGSANFTDRYIQRRDVFIDQHQDWFLLKSLKSNGYSIYQFKRPVVLSNSEDRTIENKPSYAIFAFGDSIPGPNDDISYHKSNRGSLVVQFLTTSN